MPRPTTAAITASAQSGVAAAAVLAALPLPEKLASVGEPSVRYATIAATTPPPRTRERFCRQMPTSDAVEDPPGTLDEFVICDTIRVAYAETRNEKLEVY